MLCAGAGSVSSRGSEASTSAYLNHKARFTQARRNSSGKGLSNPVLSTFAEEDSDSDEDHRAIEGLIGPGPEASAAAARLPRGRRMPSQGSLSSHASDVGSAQAMRDAQQSLLDTWVDDMPSVPVLAHLKRKLSKS